jgi:hypothetical protein
MQAPAPTVGGKGASPSRRGSMIEAYLDCPPEPGFVHPSTIHSLPEHLVHEANNIQHGHLPDTKGPNRPAALPPNLTLTLTPTLTLGKEKSAIAR